jgi:5-methylcytosine-specific restriction endonuclease McrA
VRQQVLGGMTKSEFTDLYRVQMVGEGKPGRKYYDQLMMLAPLQKCPYCGFGQASTLDHFLSKARYPAFSVLSTNLVPACTDCNKGKGASAVTQEIQTLHPYFEQDVIETEPWLYAEVIECAPPAARYFVQPPSSCQPT